MVRHFYRTIVESMECKITKNRAISIETVAIVPNSDGEPDTPNRRHGHMPPVRTRCPCMRGKNRPGVAQDATAIPTHI